MISEFRKSLGENRITISAMALDKNMKSVLYYDLRGPIKIWNLLTVFCLSYYSSIQIHTLSDQGLLSLMTWECKFSSKNSIKKDILPQKKKPNYFQGKWYNNDYQKFTKCSFAQIAPVVSSILKEKTASAVSASRIMFVTTPYKLMLVILSRRSTTNVCKTSTCKASQ